MTDVTPEERAAGLSARFDAVSSAYDELPFLRQAALWLAEAVPAPRSARVLDVGTGTGTAALRVAERVGLGGSVVGVDVSPAMVAVARGRVAPASMAASVVFREGDACDLAFPDESFDVVLSASTLFFLPDMLGALREWRRVLVPGGTVAFSSFGPMFLQPLRELWSGRLSRHGLSLGRLPTHRLHDEHTAKALLERAGFADAEVGIEQLGYHLPTAEDRWRDITAGLEGLPLRQVTPLEQEKIRLEHLADIEAVATPAGVWVDLPVLWALGRRPTTRTAGPPGAGGT